MIKYALKYIKTYKYKDKYNVKELIHQVNIAKSNLKTCRFNKKFKSNYMNSYYLTFIIENKEIVKRKRMSKRVRRKSFV